MKHLDCIVIGGSTIDVMFYTDESVIIRNKKDITKQKLIAFEYGAKIRPQSAQFTMGGGAQNVSVGMAKLGLKAGIFTAVGGDGYADEIRQNLKKNKVDSTLFKVFKDDRTSFSFIVNTGKFNEHVIFTYRGANYVIKITQADLKRAKSKWYYITSLQGDTWKTNVRNIFKVAKEKKVKISWNPGGTQLEAGFNYLKKYIKQTEVFNVNKDEAIELALSYGKKMTNIQQLLMTIKSWGPRVVVITDAANGAYAFDGNKIYHKKALNIKGINTTGAGDSFGSAFIWALIKYDSVSKALAAGIYNSNSVITEIGAQQGLLSARQLKAKIK